MHRITCWRYVPQHAGTTRRSYLDLCNLPCKCNAYSTFARHTSDMDAWYVQCALSWHRLTCFSSLSMANPPAVPAPWSSPCLSSSGSSDGFCCSSCSSLLAMVRVAPMPCRTWQQQRQRQQWQWESRAATATASNQSSMALCCQDTCCNGLHTWQQWLLSGQPRQALLELVACGVGRCNTHSMVAHAVAGAAVVLSVWHALAHESTEPPSDGIVL